MSERETFDTKEDNTMKDDDVFCAFHNEWMSECVRHGVDGIACGTASELACGPKDAE